MTATTRINRHQAETPDSDEEFITVKAFSRATGVSRNTIYEAIKQGQLPGVLRIGRRIVIHRKTLEEALPREKGRIEEV